MKTSALTAVGKILHRASLEEKINGMEATSDKGIKLHFLCICRATYISCSLCSEGIHVSSSDELHVYPSVCTLT